LPDPESGPYVRRAFELIASGRHKKPEVLRMVTAEGLRTRKGKPVSVQTFEAALRNPIYCGLMKVKGWDLPPMHGDFEPIISKELFDLAQAVLDGKRLSVTAYNRNHPDFPLRCFVRCAACNKPITGSWSKGRNRHYAYYRCRNKGRLAFNTPRDTMEAQFTEYLEAMRPKPEYIRLFREIVLDTWRCEASLDQRQRLQKVLFPQGVTYSADGRFGTAETSVIFRLLQVVPAEKDDKASPTGFEGVAARFLEMVERNEITGIFP